MVVCVRNASVRGPSILRGSTRVLCTSKQLESWSKKKQSWPRNLEETRGASPECERGMLQQPRHDVVVLPHLGNQDGQGNQAGRRERRENSRGRQVFDIRRKVASSLRVIP